MQAYRDRKVDEELNKPTHDLNLDQLFCQQANKHVEDSNDKKEDLDQVRQQQRLMEIDEMKKANDALKMMVFSLEDTQQEQDKTIKNHELVNQQQAKNIKEQAQTIKELEDKMASQDQINKELVKTNQE